MAMNAYIPPRWRERRRRCFGGTVCGSVVISMRSKKQGPTSKRETRRESSMTNDERAALKKALQQTVGESEDIASTGGRRLSRERIEAIAEEIAKDPSFKGG